MSKLKFRTLYLSPALCAALLVFANSPAKAEGLGGLLKKSKEKLKEAERKLKEDLELIGKKDANKEVEKAKKEEATAEPAQESETSAKEEVPAKTGAPEVKQPDAASKPKKPAMEIPPGISIKTRIFLQDLAKYQDYNETQYVLIMKIMDTLTEDEIAQMNSAPDPDRSIQFETFNRSLIDLYKELYASLSSEMPGGSSTEASLPRTGQFRPVTGYFFFRFEQAFGLFPLKEFINDKLVPEKDYVYFFDRYSNFLLDYLNKFQSLQEKAEERGIRRWGVITQVSWGITPDFLRLKEKDGPNHYFGRNNRSVLLNALYDWQSNRKNEKFLALNSHQKMLVAARQWFEFLVENEFVNQEYLEPMMLEIEWIEKRLAKLAEAEKKDKEMPTQATEAAKAPEGPATEKPKEQKLELPDL